MPPSGPRWRGPFVAVAAVLVAFALRWSLRPLIGATDAPLQMFFLAVFVAAWAGGLLTGCSRPSCRWSSLTRPSSSIPTACSRCAAPDIFRIGVFVLIGIVFSVMSESRLRRSSARRSSARRLLEEQDRRAAALAVGRRAARAAAAGHRSRAGDPRQLRTRSALQVRQPGQRRSLRRDAGRHGRAPHRRVPRPGADGRDRAVHHPRAGRRAGRVRDDLLVPG